MSAAPLEAITNLADGSIPSNDRFFRPIFDFAKGLIGAAAGNPDANSGGPLIARNPAYAFLAFTNAGDIVNYPGTLPANIYSTAFAQNVTVPSGQMLLVQQFIVNGSTAPAAPVTVNDGANTTTVALLGASSQHWLGWPILLDQGWSINSPQDSGWYGLVVLRDTQLVPIVRAVTSTSTYTVPNGKTLWVLGVAGSAGSFLETAGGVPICVSGSGGVGAGNGNGIGSSPVSVSAGTVIQSPTAGAVSFWGVLL